MKKTTDETMTQAVAAYTGLVTRCRAGRARAPAMKQTGEAHFRCTCGHAGTMPYPKLFKRLRRGKPMKLTCRKCGRVFRSGERAMFAVRMKAVPVIAMTAYALAGDEAKALAAGCNGYVPKPFSPRALLAKVREFLP
jgi:hypothetical protein